MKLRICACSTRRYSTRKRTSLSQLLLQQPECRAFSNAKFSKSRDIYLIVSSARARTAVATTAAAAAPSGLRRAKSVGRTHSLEGCGLRGHKHEREACNVGTKGQTDL